MEAMRSSGAMDGQIMAMNGATRVVPPTRRAARHEGINPFAAMHGRHEERRALRCMRGEVCMRGGVRDDRQSWGPCASSGLGCMHVSPSAALVNGSSSRRSPGDLVLPARLVCGGDLGEVISGAEISAR